MEYVVFYSRNLLGWLRLGWLKIHVTYGLSVPVIESVELSETDRTPGPKGVSARGLLIHYIYMCIYIYIYVYMYVHVCMCIYIYIHMYVCMYVCICICVYV